jgi:hypothetical protein
MPDSRFNSASGVLTKACLSALMLASMSSAAISAEGPAAADIMGKAAYAELQAGGKAVRTGKDATLSLLPAHSSSEGIRAAIAAERPSIVVETLFSLPRARASGRAVRGSELASIYGIMRSFGTLKGIEYYSITHKAMRVLYDESYRIGDAVARSPLPDQGTPAADSIPASETLLAFQKDSSLGANVYRYGFTSFPDAIFVEATNLTRMVYGFVPMVAPEGFKTRLLVIPAEDAIVFYSVISANPPGIIRGRLGDSLANRAEALFRWFSSKYASVKAGS